MAQQTLTVTQLYALARKAGLSQVHAVTAAAVGMAESSGRAWITSANPDGGTNVGIWQLDTKGKGAGYTVAQLQNPATNAAVMAKGSSDGKDWSAWSTFTGGAYTAWLSQAQTAAAQEGFKGSSWIDTILHDAKVAWDATDPTNLGKAGAGAVGSLLQLPKQVTDFLSALEEPVRGLMWLANPGNWARIIAGVFGFFLLIAGLVTLGMSGAL